MSKPIPTGYDASQIQVLEGLEPVRKRPGMYIGSTGIEGLHQIVKEIADNSVDEVMAGSATRVDVVLQADGGVMVSDDGRGIPIETHPKTGKSTLETVLTVLHAGGRLSVQLDRFDPQELNKLIAGTTHGQKPQQMIAGDDCIEVTVE